MLLLDIDIMIDVLRRYPPALAWLTSLGMQQLALPGYAERSTPYVQPEALRPDHRADHRTAIRAHDTVRPSPLTRRCAVATPTAWIGAF